MRIALVTTELLTPSRCGGGLANHVHRLAGALTAAGHEAVVIGPALDDPATGDDDPDGARAAIEAVPLGSGRIAQLVVRASLGLLHPLVSTEMMGRALTRRLAALHRQRPFDVVQFPQLGGVARTSPAGVPTVIRFSSHTMLCRRHGGYDHRDPLTMLQLRALERAAVARADALFAPSHFVAGKLAQELGRPVKVIEPPFFLETAARDESLLHQRLAGRRFVVFVGRLNRLKGTLVLAEIAQPLLARHPELTIAVAGGEQAGWQGGTMAEFLLESAGPFRDRIELLGEIPHSQLYPVLQGATAVLLPSLIDNLPNTCLEAMALGRVVVATSGSSFEQLIDHGRSGLLAAPGDAGDLLRMVDSVLAMTDPGRAEIGRLAAARISRLAPEHTLPPLLALYREAAGRRVGGAE